MSKITGKQARAFLKRMNYTKPVFENELDAVRRVMIIKSLGYQVNVTDIDKELKLTRERIKREGKQS